MIENKILLDVFGAWLDENYPEHGVNIKMVDEFTNFMKKDLYNKMEIIITKGDRKIIYDDSIGVITYYNNSGDCCQINTPITSTINDIYKKMELICIELGLPKEL